MTPEEALALVARASVNYENKIEALEKRMGRLEARLNRNFLILTLGVLVVWLAAVW